MGTLLVGVLLLLPMYISNVWNTGHLPFNSNKPFDCFGQRYNISRILDGNGNFNLNLYEQYSVLSFFQTKIWRRNSIFPLDILVSLLFTSHPTPLPSSLLFWTTIVRCSMGSKTHFNQRDEIRSREIPTFICGLCKNILRYLKWYMHWYSSVALEWPLPLFTSTFLKLLNGYVVRLILLTFSVAFLHHWTYSSSGTSHWNHHRRYEQSDYFECPLRIYWWSRCFR